MRTSTIAIDTPFERPDAYGSLSMPVYHTAAYEFATAEEMSDAFTGKSNAPSYSRVTNPTVTYLEQKVKAITGGTHVYALNSGMAAISNILMALAGNGKTIITSPHLFGNTFALITGTLARFGVKHKLVDFTHVEEVEKAADEKGCCCMFLEIITNPQQEVADIRAVSKIAREKHIPLVVDTTMIPFTEFSGKELGIDIEIVSSTKIITGGATSLGGLAIDYGNYRQVEPRIRYELLYNLGAIMTPHAAYMQSLGLETLSARYRVQSGNALNLAKRLKEVPEITRVTYIGLEDNPFHSLAKSLYGETGGAMVTFDLKDEASCFTFMNRLRLIRRATNIYDNKTLAIHPYSTIFGNFSPQQRLAMDVLPTTIRLSIGLEDTDDIFNDIIQGLRP